MTKTQEERSELIRVGKSREYTLEICRCKKYICAIEVFREYEILERA